MIQILRHAVTHERDVAQIVFGKIEFHPLAVCPWKLLVLFVKVRLFAIEVDAILEVDVRDLPCIEHTGDHALSRMGSGLPLVEYLQMILRDAESNEFAFAAQAGEV